MVERSEKILENDLSYGIDGLSDRPTHGVFMYEEWDDFEDERDECDNDLSPAQKEHLNEANGSDEDEWEEEEVDEEEEGDEEEEDEDEEDRRFREMDDDDKWRRGYFYTGLKEDY
jgi:hypothetical protein